MASGPPFTSELRASGAGTARRRNGQGGGPRRHVGYLIGGVAALALAVVFAVLIFFQVVEGPAPGRLSLPAAGSAGSIGPAAGPVDGTWKVASGSEVGYRVQEILFGLHHTAVGRTTQVSGGIRIAGSTVTAADFTVQMASVHSGQAGRDVQWRDNIMDTGAYPTATFRLTSPIRFGTVPPVGTVVTDPARGDLRLRDVTQPISFTIRAERLTSGVLDLDAEIPVTFSRWRIPNPSFAVAKVGGTGTLEVLLRLTRA